MNSAKNDLGLVRFHEEDNVVFAGIVDVIGGPGIERRELAGNCVMFEALIADEELEEEPVVFRRAIEGKPSLFDLELSV